MRVLFLGDIVGNPGVSLVTRAVPLLRERERVDVVVANGENASGGAGMSPGAYRRLKQAGVDAFTMGDHIYKKQEVVKVMDSGAPICKPANFPPDAPGREFVVVPTQDGGSLGIFSLLGRLFMRPVDCPFRAADRIVNRLAEQTRCILVDMHAEATAEKALMARYLDGKVSAVLGTHTHVPTADERILPGGTACVTDVGMTGPYDSILGRRVDRVLSTTLTFIPSQFEVATGDPRLAGAIVDIDASTGKATSITRICIRGDELPPAH